MTGFRNALAKWACDDHWIDRTFQRAQLKELVTFDIFDTCLTRNVDSPADIFAMVEQHLLAENRKAAGFAQARENAEMAAHHCFGADSRFGEMTFDEIYAQLPRFIPLSAEDIAAAKAAELKMERQALFPVGDMLSLTEKLNAAHIAYAFVSDMYLPKAFLQQVLTDCGYRGWKELIISCEHRKTKFSGAIWSIEELQGKKILHIGDNRHSDFIMPQKYGVETRLYSRAHCQPRTGCKLSPAVLPFSTAHRYTEMLLRADPAFSADPEYDQKRMYALGQSFGVILVGAFIFWLMERVKKNRITHLAFCARDGWLMREAWHVLTRGTDTPVTDSYLYVSRKVLTLGAGALTCTPDIVSPAMLEFLSQHMQATTFTTILERIRSLAPSLYEDARKQFNNGHACISKGDNHAKLQTFLAENSQKLYPVFQHYNTAITGYFKQEKLCDHKRTGIVDLGWNGTMQRGIRQLCRQIDPRFSCMGFYYGLWNTASSNRYSAGPMESAFFSEFDRQTDMRKNTQGVDLIEELHSASGGSTSAYRYENGCWKPVTVESAEERRQYEMLIMPFQKGVLDGLGELAAHGQTAAGLRKDDLTTDSARDAYRLLFLSPTSDEVAVLLKISHNPLFDHSVNKQSGAPRSPRLHDYQKVMRNYAWTIGLMKQWLTTAPPARRKTINKFVKQHIGFLEKRERRPFDTG